MATRTPAALADGQLATTKTTLYTVPASTILYPTLLVCFNTNAASQTIIIYVNKSGASRTYARAVLIQNERMELHFNGEILEAGDLIEGQTTTATAVDFVLSGVKET